MFSDRFTRRIEESYEKRRGLVPAVFCEIEKKMQGCTQKEKLLLHYLYGNMPVSDMLNYSFEIFLDYARHGVFLWEDGPFSGEVEEEIFCQYVVYHRINTEDIQPCRAFFYEKAKGEAADGSSMEETALTLNYWCSQEASYRASDERTAAPMTVYTSGYGRCGEESAFTASVLRSMGIPARQVYAPRWSHCDDNHAWVEVKCNKTWHFLGACEPEEVLDKGWFLHASSRAMLIHSRWYGNLAQNGLEAAAREDKTVGTILSKQGIVTELNETGRYANTRTVCIQVLDEKKTPVQGADIRIEILNYAEFFPVAFLVTDEMGIAKVDLGQGSCRIYVWKENQCCSKIVCVETKQDITLVLKQETDGMGSGNSVSSETGWCTFECFAPKDAIVNAGTVTEEQKKRQKEKLALRTALRLKKTGTGNEAEKEKFLSIDSGEDRKELLLTLSQKDVLDLKADILESHLVSARQYEGNYPREIYTSYLLAPRIWLESLSDYRTVIDTCLTKEEKERFREKPEQIWAYIRETIQEMEGEEYDALLTLPGVCMKHKVGNRQSQKLLFAAICRTLGIPARLSRIDGAMEYYHGQKFIRVNEESVGIGEPGNGCICFHAPNPQQFVYLQNWSVVRKGVWERELLDLTGYTMSDGLEVTLSPGRYEIVTANRLPNGNILGRSLEVEVKTKEKHTVTLSLEEAELSQMLESVPVPSFELEVPEKAGQDILDILTGRNHLVIWLVPGQEPTEHILNELRERAAEFNQNQTEILFIVDNKEALLQATMKKTMGELKNVQVYFDGVEERVNVLGRRFYVDPESIPLILVTDSKAHCVYATSGYNVGTADMILKIVDAGI